MDENNEYRTFDDASAAARQMYGTDGAPEMQTAAETVPAENAPEADSGVGQQEGLPANAAAETAPDVSPQEAQPMNMLSQAVTTAEQTLTLLQQERAENEQLRQQLYRMQNLSRQQNEQAEAAEEQRVFEDEVPSIDFASLAFDDDETIQRKQAEYTKAMAEYNRRQVMAELEPYLAEAREGLAQRERSEALEQLAHIPQMAGLNDSIGDVERIIANNPIFAASRDVPLADKYINAYALLRGMNNISDPPKPPAPPTNEDFMQMYHNSPELRDMVERERIAELNRGSGANAVPVLSADGGASNAALNIPDTPKTFEEAKELARTRFFNK